MPSAEYNYDAAGRLTSVFYATTGSRTIYNYDSLGNRIATYDIPGCCSPKFFILTKSGDFNVSDGPGALYLITTTCTISFPPSPADGGVYKFKVLSGVATAAFSGTEQFFHANGVADQNLVLTTRSGCLELIAIAGGWLET